jgi:imidazolonepropionase-like amidohydrolase
MRSKNVSRMLRPISAFCSLALLLGLQQRTAWPQAKSGLNPYVVEAGPILLRHVRVIYGRQQAPSEDYSVLIRSGRISWLGPDAQAPDPKGAKIFDETGNSVMPGLVMLHEHLFTTSASSGQQPFLQQQGFTFPKMYLAAGVTTIRTAGSIEPYMDLEIKRQIDAGDYPGPRMFLTAPYLDGIPPGYPQMHGLTGPDDASRTVAYWASEGMTSFKAYVNITRAELGAAIRTAHEHGLKVTGHLCSVGFREAVDLGIDNLEHGLIVDTEFFSKKQPDICPELFEALQATTKLDIAGENVQALIHSLVSHHVAVTSTLAVLEDGERGLPWNLLSNEGEFMSDRSWMVYMERRALRSQKPFPPVLTKEQQFEKEFYRAGGTLLAGSDPTGMGGTLPGFGDQRELELLVEAGLTPMEAINVATEQGARFLGCDSELGTIDLSKKADLIVIKGNPSKNISDVRNIQMVIKDGLAYDPQKLLDSVRTKAGLVGIR